MNKHLPNTRSASAREGSKFRASLRNDGTYELLVYEDIGENWWDGGGITAKNFKAELDRATGPYSQISVRINSPGGDAFEGVAIHNMLRATGKPVAVFVDGLAASAASIIAMAGDTITMGTGAMMMIHNAWSIGIGNAADLQKQVDALSAIDQSIAQVYATKTGLKASDVLEMMAAETWLTAADCMKQGFATAKAKRGEDIPVPEPLAMAKRFKALARFHNVPAEFKGASSEECLCDCVGCKDGRCDDCSDTLCNDAGCKDCPMQEQRESTESRISPEMARATAEPHIPQLFAQLSAGHLGAEMPGKVRGAEAILAIRRGTAALNLAKENGNTIARVKGVIAPYRSLSGDLGGFQEEYQPGCFAEFLKSDDPRVLYNHNIDAILGRKSAGTARFWEEPDGLHYDADLPDTQCGRDLQVSLERGDVKESSAAFYIYQHRWEQRGEVRVRVVEKARLVEGSPHTFAAYGNATAEPEVAQPVAEADYELELTAARLRLLSVA